MEDRRTAARGRRGGGPRLRACVRESGRRGVEGSPRHAPPAAPRPRRKIGLGPAGGGPRGLARGPRGAHVPRRRVCRAHASRLLARPRPECSWSAMRTGGAGRAGHTTRGARGGGAVSRGGLSCCLPRARFWSCRQWRRWVRPRRRARQRHARQRVEDGEEWRRGGGQVKQELAVLLRYRKLCANTLRNLRR